MNDVWVGGLIGVGGVMVGAALSWFQAAHEQRKQRRLDAQYLAIRVLCVLDNLIEICAAAAADEGEEDREGYTKARTEAPDGPEYPTDVDWRSIDPDLMYSILSLPNEVKSAHSAVSAAWEFADAPEFTLYFEERTQQYGSCGLAADKICRALRANYKVPPNKYPKWWNPVNVIRKELARIEKTQRERLERHAEYEAMHPPPPPPPPPSLDTRKD